MSDNNTLEKFLGDYTNFLIPEYQRDYAWEKKNLDELWEDLEESLESQNEGHYLGTIVLARKGQKEADIIDGQQRLTTIFMILSALWVRLDDSTKKYYEFRVLFNEKSLIKLQVAPANKEFFKHIWDLLNKNNLPSEKSLKADGFETDTQGKKNLYEVFNAILAKVRDFDEKTSKKYFEELLNMEVIRFIKDDEGAAIRTFQSVNDRGVPLRLLDKLKSLLIYYSNRFCDDKNLDSRINEHFGAIFRYSMEIFNHTYRSAIFATQSNEINDIERDMFRYHLASKVFAGLDSMQQVPKYLGLYKESAENHYVKLKSEIKKITKDKENLKKFLEDYNADLEAFFKAMLDILNDISENEAMFKALMIENINPMYYNTFVRLKIDEKLNKEMIVIFSKTDCILTKLNGRLKIAYKLIEAYNGDVDKLKEQMYKECKIFGSQYKLDEFVKNSFNETHKKIFHYLFIEREESNLDIGHLIELLENEDKRAGKKLAQSVEHTIPQIALGREKDKILPNESLIDERGFKSKEELEDFIYSYGNSLSLEGRYNSEAQDKSDEEKRKAYRKSALPFVKSFDPSKVNKDFIDKRNKEMKKWLKEFFKDFL